MLSISWNFRELLHHCVIPYVGICSEVWNGYVCECKKDWTGKDCSQSGKTLNVLRWLIGNRNVSVLNSPCLVKPFTEAILTWIIITTATTVLLTLYMLPKFFFIPGHPNLGI